jgi:PleD family two-component response regulator
MNESELSPLVRLSSKLSNNSIIVDSESEHVNAKIKALVVDDSSMNRRMVRRLLEMKGIDADDNEVDGDAQTMMFMVSMLRMMGMTRMSTLLRPETRQHDPHCFRCDECVE